MLLLLSLLGPAFAGDADDLAAAMEIDAADVVTATLTAAESGAYDIMSSSGTIAPMEGADFTYLFTGRIGTSPQSGTDLGTYGATDDKTTLTLELTVPSTANSFTLDFYFLSAEYPEYVGSPYNDSFEANVTGTAWSGNAAIDSAGNQICINSVLFTVTKSSELTGTGYDGNVGGGTGWLTVVVPVDPGDTIELELTVYDVSDGIYDSTVVLDGFEWSTSDIDIPTIVREIDIDWLSPKRGPTDGSATTQIIGENFTETCQATFDGVETPTTYIDENTLEVVPPAHDAGMVDVTVTCIGVEDTLVGAYTYYDVESGDGVPPEILTVSPYQVGTAGGDVVGVEGAGFVDGSVVLVDGVEQPTDFVSDTRLQIMTPAHAAGLVDVQVANPDGLFDTAVGALYYFDDPADAVGDTGDTDADTDAPSDTDATGGGQVGGSCNTGAMSPGVLWMLALLFVRRRS